MSGYIKLVDGIPEIYASSGGRLRGRLSADLHNIGKLPPPPKTPEVDYNEWLATLDIYPFTDADQPAVADGEQAMLDDLPTQQQDGSWVRGWTVTRKTDTEIIAGIKAEAYRRIIEIVPEWKQRNLFAQAAILQDKGRANWTAEELAAWNAGAAIWSQVEAIRAASDVLEAMSPLPTDFTAPARWP